MRVLAFEDHYDIEALLLAGGVDVDQLVLEQRWNSSDALDHVRRFAPDVLLLDHYMPPISGHEVLRTLLFGGSTTAHRCRHVQRLGEKRRHGGARC